MLHIILNPFPPVSVTVSKTELWAGCIVSKERSLFISPSVESVGVEKKKNRKRSQRSFSKKKKSELKKLIVVQFYLLALKRWDDDGQN